MAGFRGDRTPARTEYNPRGCERGEHPGIRWADGQDMRFWSFQVLRRKAVHQPAIQFTLGQSRALA